MGVVHPSKPDTRTMIMHHPCFVVEDIHPGLPERVLQPVGMGETRALVLRVAPDGIDPQSCPHAGKDFYQRCNTPVGVHHITGENRDVR
jgi:hypothetical protein